MIRFAPSVRRRRRSLALGTSTLAWGLMLPAAAHAQCAPDPTVTYGTTTCSGTDADGISVTTTNTSLTVESGASVSNSGAPAIAVDVPVDSYYGYTSTTINVLGSVSAPGQAAISATSGAPPSNSYYYYSNQQVSLTVAAGGSVSGATAMTLSQSPGNTVGTISATIDNAGMLTGTSGTALLGNVITTSPYGYSFAVTNFGSITNRATGVINGGIVGPVGYLSNYGSIDGGAGSALDASAASYSSVTNAAGASIRSTSAAATIVAGLYNSYVTNGGTIANGGPGGAIAGGSLSVTNQFGGQISGDITATGSLNLVNYGVVTGNLTAGSGTGYGALTLVNQGTVTGNVAATGGSSFIDSTGGTINGSLTLGGGSNTLVARYAGNGALAAGITGAISASGSSNSERVIFDSDVGVTGPIALNAGFQNLVLVPNAGVTTTLESGFSTSTPLVLDGSGTIVNRATISVAGSAVSDLLSYSYGTAGSFNNEGSITSTSGTYYGQAAIALNNRGFVNSGQVTANSGGGVYVSSHDVNNSGTITASDIGAYVFDGVLTNSGTIVSTGDAGVYLFGNVGYTGSNSGTIWGATTGASTSIYLTNTGTIGSAGTGVTVQAYGYLISAAAGVVNGGSGGAVTVNYFNAGVANAGTINGDVTFNGAYSGYYSNNLNYIALTGGVLNGNLTLTGGATLVTDLVNNGPGQFAGITGAVTADSSSTLRYSVNADASTVLPPGNVGPFGSVGYQLANSATLTLTAANTQSRAQTLQLAGNGTVDLDVNIAPTAGAAIQSVSAITYPGGPTMTDGLSITSRGALAVTANSNNPYYYYPNGAVTLSGNDSFTNAGDISVTDHLGYNTPAITGGKSVTNSGNILLDGGIGITGSQSIVNTGTISQIAGGMNAIGVRLDTASLDNSGTISVGGNAVQLGSYYYGSNAVSLTNSGTLESTGGVAIAGNGTYSGTTPITNLAGGTITGTGGAAVQVSGTRLSNAGAILGTVDLGYATSYYYGGSTRSSFSSTYIAAGGTIAGDLLFGDGSDLFLQTDTSLGVSGVIDGGGGTDIFGSSLTSSGTVSLSLTGVTNFEQLLVEASGSDTVVTTTGTLSGDLYAIGDGSVVNQATLTGALTTTLPYPLSNSYGPNPLFPNNVHLSSLTNAGSVGSVAGAVASFTNSGTVGGPNGYGTAVSLQSDAALSFANSGTITAPSVSNPYYYYPTPAVALSAVTGTRIANSGQISGGLSAYASGITTPASVTLDVDNSGTITSNNNPAVGLTAGNYYYFGPTIDGSARIANSGTISVQAGANAYVATGLNLAVQHVGTFDYAITNSGTITASTASGVYYPNVAIGLEAYGTGLYGAGPSGAHVAGTIVNGAGATISADSDIAYGIYTAYHALNLANAGTIRATGTNGGSYGVFTYGAFDNSITNSGTISGTIAIALDAGNDSIDNAGTIDGNVWLGDGDDRFVQRVGSTVTGVVDGGAGQDGYVIDTTGGSLALTAAQITGFETLTQTGGGTGSYSGSFDVGTVDLAGGTLSVGAGQTFATLGTTAITGASGSGNLSVVNDGTIGGGITLADGDDLVVNNGTIAGPVQLGAGNDSYSDGAGSVAAGGVDGGAGTDLYRVVLAGDRSGISQRTNFEALAVDGSGTLSLTLDQDFQSVTLGGASLGLTLAGHSVAMVTGSGAAETLSADGDLPRVALGGGDDVLALGATNAAGSYDGGAGSNTLGFTATGPVTLSGTATGFQTVSLAGNSFTIAGTLDTAGAPLSFGAGDYQVTLANGGVLTANQVTFGPGANRFTIAGSFAGSIDGGAGTDSLAISGGSAAAPILLNNVSHVETFGMTAGFARISGTAAFNAIDMTGGRLVGEAGSTIAAPDIQVRQGATFGSAGTVTGNVTVAGTLSPGASPGTMTVNGNVALASGSTSLFELSPTVSDKLVVNGSVSIASGATLQLVELGTLRPGTSYDLIVASGGVTGSFSTILKPASLFGVVVQRSSGIQLLGQFANPASSSAQVARSIAYANATILVQPATSAYLNALPALLTSAGASNPQAFAQLTPEAYATAAQIGVDNGLVLAEAARGPSFAASGDAPHAYTFAATLGQWHRLGADASAGTAAAHARGYGFLGGIGFGAARWSVGAFGGYLNTRQTIDALGARTKADGAVAGVQGRFESGSGFGFDAAIAYDGGEATTTRALPGGSASGRYGLHSWIGDMSAHYNVSLAGGWALTPRAGFTYVRTTRDGVAESGGSAFALTVARDRHDASFVDGAIGFGRADASAAAFRPYVSLGVRYQVEGARVDALAGYAGGGLGLMALGASRSDIVGTVSAGAAYRLPSGLDLFASAAAQSGRDDHRESVSAGVRLRF